MQKVRILVYGLTAVVCVWGIGSTVARAQVKSQDARVALVDNCDPNTFPAGLCVVLPRPGDTTFTEFLGLLFSPLSKTVIGHPAWRFEPGYLDVRAGQTVRVTNSGGEGHTFTEVAAFGGGSIPLLNGVNGPTGTFPLTPAPECPANPAALAVLAPGDTVGIKLSPGAHNFECCIHPWMRAVIDVEDK
jgi:plastocyanin